MPTAITSFVQDLTGPVRDPVVRQQVPAARQCPFAGCSPLLPPACWSGTLAEEWRAQIWTMLLVNKVCEGRRNITAYWLPDFKKNKKWKEPSLTVGLSAYSAKKSGKSPNEMANNKYVQWVPLKSISKPLEKQGEKMVKYHHGKIYLCFVCTSMLKPLTVPFKEPWWRSDFAQLTFSPQITMNSFLRNDF